MSKEKFVVWSNLDLDLDDWRADLEDEYPGLIDDELIEKMTEINNNKIYRILGRRGNTTIPYEIRKKCGFSRNDLISFEEHDQNTVIIRHEKVCDGCGKLNLNEKKAVAKPTNEETLLDFVDSLSRDEQAAMLQHLCKLWLAAGETNA